MPQCVSNKYTGKVVGLEFFIGCGDVLPTEAQWRKLGAMRNKEFSVEWETIDATADDSIGSLRENITSFQSLTISGDGTLKRAGTGAADLKAITKHAVQPTETGGEPVVWLRMTFPDLTFIAYMILTTMTRTGAYDDLATYTMEAQATASDFGLIVLDTPDPDAPALTALAIDGAATLAPGASTQLTVTATPATPAPSLMWQSSNTDIATVDQNGLVTAQGLGPVDITVQALGSTLTDTHTITVEEPAPPTP